MLNCSETLKNLSDFIYKKLLLILNRTMWEFQTTIQSHQNRVHIDSVYLPKSIIWRHACQTVILCHEANQIHIYYIIEYAAAAK